MPRFHLRLARFLQRLAEPATPRRPARVRINPRHPRPTAKATIRAAERARIRKAKQAHPREGRALQVWTAVGTVLAGIAAVPALFIALNALKISEQQAVLAAQQFANRVTAADSATYVPDEPLRDTITYTMQNSNTVPVTVEGRMFPQERPGFVLFLSPFTIPACTEVDFLVGLPDDPALQDERIKFGLHNTIDGRLWSVPAPGEQARIVETWLPWQQEEVTVPKIYLQGIHDGVERMRKVSSCV
ncbi:hypothetical protein [Nonomuraea sp. NPDC050643]|uniref:hypothetical protein n=1 Tax=Nonomuraea sp. NPDC050643 TaxID=3155660 RepID=UPI00340576F9